MTLARELLRELTAACREDPRAAELLAQELAPFLNGNGDRDEWLSTEQAAAYTGRHPMRIRDAARTGALLSAQPGGPRGRRQYRRSDLDAWLAR